MRINHIAINCFDVTKVTDFFLLYFDTSIGGEYDNPKTGLHSCMLFFTEGSTKLELMSWPDISVLSYQSRRQGFTHFSVSVGNRAKVDALTARLKNDGYELKSGPRVTGDGYYESCILGPENIEIEITI
jgi:lactoylglutathione lyase